MKKLYIEPGSRHFASHDAWENGYIESFKPRLRDELYDRETFYSIKEAQALVGQWRCHYNHVSPHSALNNRPPTSYALLAKPSQGSPHAVP